MIRPQWFHIASFLLLILGTVQVPSTSGTKIDPELKQKIDSAPKGSTWNIIVGFKMDEHRNDAIYASVANITDEYERTYQGVLKMEKHTNESQEIVLNILKAFGGSGEYKKLEFESLWINNNLAIYRATKELIYMLGNDSKPENGNITEIIEDKAIFRIPRPLGGGIVEEESGLKKGGDPYAPSPLTYGINEIKAPAWWRKKFNGTGVIVGHMDSGVDIRHPSLKWNWYGKPGGWWDPGNESNTWPYEYDKQQSHGTHSLGTAVGWGTGSSSKNESDVSFFGVGVAPGARWISCLACQRDEEENDTSPCPQSYIEKCAKWFVCPNKTNGCRSRPNVITVSFGCPQNKTYRCEALGYRVQIKRVIAMWIRYGIIPIFAAGNNGYIGCQSIDFPAELEDVIAVGSVDKHEVLADTSSWGPPLHEYDIWQIRNDGIYKPDFVAPGVNIISTVYTGFEGKFLYDSKSGTSMATPHMAGAVALLLSRTEGLTTGNIREILEKAVVPNFQIKSRDSTEKCDGLADDAEMNHKFGYGGLRLPDPDSLDPIKYPVKRPTRRMPPPPDYSDLPDDYDPSQASVHKGMLEVVMMALSIVFKNML